jgi:multimeric flavodoxin WrbA
MQKVYPELNSADMLVLASPVHYFGLSGQLESTIARFYAGMKPAKVTKMGLIASSHSPNVFPAIEAQYKIMVGFFGAEDAGIIKCVGDDNKSDAALAKAEEFGKSL